MKTIIFKQVVVPEDRKTDIKKLITMSDSLSKYVIDLFENIQKSFVVDRNLVSKIASDTNEDPELIIDVLLSISYILKTIKEYDDKKEEYCEDLSNILKLNSDEQEKLIKLISTLYPIADKFYHIDRLKTTLYKESDILSSYDVSTKLIPIYKRNFDPELDDVEAYNPEIINYEPVVDLFFSRIKNEEVQHFQLQKRDLQAFIKLLASAEKEIQVLNQKNTI